MGKIKIKSGHDYYQNRTFHTGVGEVKFESGEAEIDEKHYSELKGQWKHIDKVEAVKTSVEQSVTTSKKKSNSHPATASANEVDATTGKLNELKEEELIELANEVDGADPEKIAKMPKEELVKYIKDNMPKS